MSARCGSIASSPIEPAGDELLRRYREQVMGQSRDLAQLPVDLAVVLHYLLLETVSWLTTFEPPRPRDAAAVRGHWSRLAHAVELFAGP